MGHIGNLKTHEMDRKEREGKTPLKKKNLAFKTTPTYSEYDEENEQEDDEELSLLVKNVRRLYNKNRFNNRRGR